MSIVKSGAAVLTATAVWTMGAGAALAASAIPQPDKILEKTTPAPTAEVIDKTAGQSINAGEVQFEIANFRLEAPDLYLDKAELTQILQAGMGKEKTMSQLNVTLNSLTRYCRAHGYPAAAAYVPAQESNDGMVTIRVIPGRLGEVKFANEGRMTDSTIRSFTAGLKSGSIIRTNELETVLYNLSDVHGTRAIGILSPGKDFGTSDLTVKLDKGKGSSAIFYVENYGSQKSGRYRYGLQDNIYDVSGHGDKLSVGTLISNADMHNYYVNYETIIGHGGTSFGVGYSRMDYNIGEYFGTKNDGTANTLSIFGKRPLYHLTNHGLTVKYGYDYRKLNDALTITAWSGRPRYTGRKHTHSGYIGITGFDRSNNFYADYELNVLTGELTPDSSYGQTLVAAARTEGRYTKASGTLNAVQRLGNRADVMLKASAQIAANNLDSSEEFYLGGANGVRAYPQGEGSGDEGILGTVETRFYTSLPGLVASTYFDIGKVRFNNDGAREGLRSTETLKGWGVGLAYNKPSDWFARLDYARRIGDDPNLSQEAKANGRTWFMLGKLW